MLLEGDPLARPAGPLNDLLRVGFGRDPDGPALVSADRSLSWRELERASATLAGGYRALGLRAGDRVASLMPNRIALVVHYLACFRAGLIATPLNYRYTFREIDHALEVSDASALLAHVERAGDVAASRLAGDLAHGVIGYGWAEAPGADGDWSQSFEALLDGEPAAAEEPAPEPSSPAVIFFTSGSTGPAKGVTHTRESLRWMIASAASAFELYAN